ncbi:MAG: phage tail sheath subtilisin-like domain-containing protein [Bacillota bacterium]|nr:phage tail sheath subtilisin-like domain-containing protein [Bacillota bacterium]
MAEYLSPGVYVEEYDNSPRSIEGVGTSAAGFVGMAEKGATEGVPVLITSFVAFKRIYGDFLSEFTHEEYRYLAYAVEQFFVNGGNRCYVSRVIPEDATCAVLETGTLSFKAANEGKWGNRIQITFSTVEKKKMQLIEKTNDTTYVAKAVAGFKEGDIVKAGEEYNRIQMIYDNNVVFEKAFDADVVDTNIIPSVLVYLVETDVLVRYNDEAEVYNGLSFNPVASNYIGTKMAGSDLVKVTAKPLEEICNPVEAILGEGKTSGTVLLAGGKDGSISKVTAGTFIGEDNGPGKRTGIQAFIENNRVSMLAVPGITIPEVVVALVGHCENMKNRVAVLDMPGDMTKTKDLIEYRNIIDSTYAAMYHPWIQVYDRAAKKPGFIPPSGAVMGIYARTDNTRGVHKAPANEPIYCTGLKTNYTKSEQDILNPEGVNLIRQLPGQGIRVWGARTASSNSTFRYVNVRRLFIYVEESIKANTNWVVFEPNDVTLWSRVNLTISTFLDNMWRTGMLAGSSPSEGFFVEIGSTTMTRDDIMNGRLICNIGIAPSRPAEFVIFRVSQMTAEAGGGEAEE